jgi:hypothetical protein
MSGKSLLKTTEHLYKNILDGIASKYTLLIGMHTVGSMATRRISGLSLRASALLFRSPTTCLDRTETGNVTKYLQGKLRRMSYN